MTIGTYVSIGLAVVFLAGTWLVSSLGRRRKAHNAATLHLLVEIERAGNPPIYVGDFGQMEPLPEVLYDPVPTEREKRIPVPARPNALGGWVRIGDERVHRSCEQAYPFGLVCSYCLPILVVHNRTRYDADGVVIT